MQKQKGPAAGGGWGGKENGEERSDRHWGKTRANKQHSLNGEHHWVNVSKFVSWVRCVSFYQMDRRGVKSGFLSSRSICNKLGLQFYSAILYHWDQGFKVKSVLFVFYGINMPCTTARPLLAAMWLTLSLWQWCQLLLPPGKARSWSRLLKLILNEFVQGGSMAQRHKKKNMADSVKYDATFEHGSPAVFRPVTGLKWLFCSAEYCW